ncbi:immunity 53 family protein [Chryseobacterium luteum]|uniref:Rhodanese-related sulfurtransferase n=1 Tax=Chryseobacterium luteum TaxID=421531 RepID=A0A085YXV8_9FLAO|nr:immunity 53 family protein [Chryseobacterium luteum]KFE97021.1 hypothetical protein IX38_21930 [Chryseobacterium luteum]
MEVIKWLENWYQLHCDGDWEHSYGVKIETIDNPGWNVKIHLADTSLENLHVEYSLLEISETDWYGYSIKNGMFNAAGDPTKLLFLIDLFKGIVEENK